MFYRTDEPHGLQANPFNAIVVPRPIGWISSVSPAGEANLAPYSFFNACAYEPPQVLFSSTGPHGSGGFKDSFANIRATGIFVVNLACWSLRDAMNRSCAAAPHGFDEFELAGLEKEKAQLIACPMVKASPVRLECVLSQIVELERFDDNPHGNRLVIGKVVGIHIRDDVIVNGRVMIDRIDPIARLGYSEYARVNEAFSMRRPSWPPVEGAWSPDTQAEVSRG